MVKLSSPYLNLVIIIGAIFLYVTVIIIQVDMNVASTDTVDALCQVGGADKKGCGKLNNGGGASCSGSSLRCDITCLAVSNDQ